MMEFFRAVSTAAILAIIVVQPVWAASTKDEINALREEVKALNEGQIAIQKELAEIKRLLQQGARAAPSQPVFKPADVIIGDSPFIGSPDATVTLVEYTDYQCPYCQRHYAQVMPGLIRTYVDSGRMKYVLRENPIPQIHPLAMGASQAALCAGDQGKYWEMHGKMFDNQKQLAIVNLKAYGVELGLDSAIFDACLDEGRHKKRISDDLASGRRLGIRGTPAFVLGLTDPNDSNKAILTQFISGAQSLDTFSRTIEELLTQAKEGKEPD